LSIENKMKNQTTLFSGAIFMALAVVLGAFGAHALKTRLSPEMLQAYKTGVEYQFYHSLGFVPALRVALAAPLLPAGGWAARTPRRTV
jgi:uncharacterized membrane protein YgdD (TMEM256/DUF423 family)